MPKKREGREPCRPLLVGEGKEEVLTEPTRRASRSWASRPAPSPAPFGGAGFFLPGIGRGSFHTQRAPVGRSAYPWAGQALASWASSSMTPVLSPIRRAWARSRATLSRSSGVVGCLMMQLHVFFAILRDYHDMPVVSIGYLSFLFLTKAIDSSGGCVSFGVY